VVVQEQHRRKRALSLRRQQIGRDAVPGIEVENHFGCGVADTPLFLKDEWLKGGARRLGEQMIDDDLPRRAAPGCEIAAGIHRPGIGECERAPGLVVIDWQVAGYTNALIAGIRVCCTLCDARAGHGKGAE